MAVTVTETPSEREQIEMLLPWHAVGTLSLAEAQRVEHALASDPELARQFDLVRDELGGTIHVNETLGAPSARAMDTLFSRIEAEAPRKHRAASVGLSERFSGWLASLSPRSLAYAAAAAVLALVLQAAVITAIVMPPSGSHGERGGYVTASAPATDTGSFAMVQFAPQANAAEIAALLKTNKLSIVDGPNAAGLFKVRVAVTALPKEALAQAVRRLQQDKAVGFIATVE
jgi:anti-sigma-K factor RskA